MVVVGLPMIAPKALFTVVETVTPSSLVRSVWKVATALVPALGKPLSADMSTAMVVAVV